jgi:hypothetical protein
MITPPELEIHPVQIIESNRKREAKFNFVKAIFLDIFLVFYSILVLQRGIYYKFILDLRELPFSWSEIGFVFAVSVFLGTAWTMTRTSLSAKLFGIAREIKLLHWTVEIFGWFLI